MLPLYLVSVWLHILAATVWIGGMAFLVLVWLGPRAALIWEQEPDSAEATRFRRLASRMGRANALLALGIVFLAVCVVRGGLPG